MQQFLYYIDGNPCRLIYFETCLCIFCKRIQERMMAESDCGLNLKLGFDGSLQKVLTWTMLDHEDTFRNQIHSSGYVKNHCLKEHRDTLKHQHLSLDLELASRHYTNDNEDLLSDCITTELPALMKHDIYADNYSSNKVLKLSLGADVDTQEKISGRKTCNEKIICSPFRQAIHLEESTYNKDLFTIPGPAYATLATQSGAKNSFETSCSFRIKKSDDFNWISQSRPLTVGMENFLERKHLYQGVEQCHKDLSCKNMLARRKLFTAREVGELDLNKALPDESFVNPIDPCTFNSSQCASSGVLHNEISDLGQATSNNVLDRRINKINYSTELSSLTQQEITASTVTTSPNKDISEHISNSTLCSVVFGSICGCLSGNKDAVNGSKNFSPENAECGISVPEKTCLRISNSDVDVEKKEEENKLHSYNSSQELHEGADSNRSPASCKSDCNTDDASSNTKNPKPSLVVKEQVEQNVTRLSETKSKSSGSKKELLAAEVDKTVKKAAVSLIYISCLARNQDHNSHESKKRKKICSAEREMPQSSSESYESIVLKQADCSVDEYCMSSTPSEAMCLEKKDNGVKLKRGRRMKDFRKEILPGLASLSRQEISEDIKIMELALRSREFKKYNSKNATRNDCISSVRSRRGRRYCS